MPTDQETIARQRDEIAGLRKQLAKASKAIEDATATMRRSASKLRTKRNITL